MGANGTSAGSFRCARATIATGLAILGLGVGLAACGGGDGGDDSAEPAGEFPVDVAAARFPTQQRLAETSDLELAIENVGEETVPNLAVTIWTGEQKADGSFNIRLADPRLSNPNRPVWILEHEYPKLLTPGLERKELDKAPTAGATAAQTDTFQFGELPAGETRTIVWRLTPVRAGTYTVHYEVAAGLEGEARAVTGDGSPVRGEFVVTITDKPPQTCVTGSGQVKRGRCPL